MYGYTHAHILNTFIPEYTTHIQAHMGMEGIRCGRKGGTWDRQLLRERKFFSQVVT